MNKSRKTTIGMVAHVDAGKTTLSEALLYRTGAIRSLGRVDHKDTFLDINDQEKDRGITIFSGQAQFQIGKSEFVLLDTPGHVDFSAEMERSLSVLDYAVLVISAKEGVQSHTITLWKLLKIYDIPTFIFINKMDMDGVNREVILNQLKERLSGTCCELEKTEELATCSEFLLEEYLSNGQVEMESIARATKSRQLFPCFFGSALKMQGVDEFISGLDNYTMDSSAVGATFDENQLIVGDNFKAITFRITRDREDRLTHLKVIEGKMKIRDTVGEEKINQIRIYSGGKYKTVEKAVSGDICVVTGLDKTEARKDSLLQAVMSYSVILPDNVNVHEAYTKLKELEEEDPQLLISWNEKNQEIQIKIMGKVQLEILEELIRERFGYDVQFGEGCIAYKETIKEPITGAGHFEPLRHYSEVHLLLEPLPRGSGMVFDSAASEDVLDKNWQRLIMTHLMEGEHLGTLSASPITDIKITILTGRAHAKHTEGGDFRQSTYRAIRQALRKSLADDNMLLLEPWYAFRLYIPNDMVGRAMSDIQRMGGNFELEAEGNQSNNSDLVCLSGNAPVSKMKDYINEVASYTKGFGQLACEFAGYEECHNQEDIIEAIGYDPDKDVDNPADSVFCSHGASHVVPWYDADELMHMDNGYAKAENPDAKGEDSVAFARDGHEMGSMARLGQGGSADSEGLDKELERIFNRTFNRDRSEPRKHLEAREFPNEIETRKLKMDNEPRTDYLLVDGYNIIFAWQDLKELAAINIDAAREALIDILCNYRGFRSTEIILVFDAYKVKGGKRHIDKVDNITVVYTAEAETADSYIERITYELAGKGKDMSKRKVGMVRVATSDRAEQIIIMGNNAHKLSAKDFKKEIEDVNAEISDYLKNLLRKNSRENPNRLNIPNGNE